MSQGPSRRDLLAGAVLGAAAGCTPNAQPERRVASYCRICTVHCGVEASVRGATVVRIEGRRRSHTRGFVCASGLSIPDLMTSPRRVLAPEVREGESLRATSWERAYARAALDLRSVIERHGARAVAVLSGWGLVRRGVGGWLKRLCDAIGTPNYASSTSICVAAAVMADELMFGRAAAADLEESSLCLLWGSNPMRSSPPVADRLLERRRQGMRLVVIDPFRTRLARLADLHVALRPGTDLELALALLGELVRSGRYDAPFVAAESVGFAELAELVRPLTPEWAAAVTGVTAEQIRRLAAMLAEAPSACGITGLAVEQQQSGLDACRAISALFAITGNVGRAGGQRLLPWEGTEGWQATRALEPAPPALSEAAIGAREHPAFARLFGEAQGNLYPRAILDDDPYPVRALIVFGANPLLTMPDSTRVRAALERLDLLVVVDPMRSETSELADVLLPASMFMERDEHVGLHRLGRVQAVVPPRGECRPDWQIISELGHALGLGAHFPWKSEREANAALQARLEAVPRKAQKYETPSGKIELASSILRDVGQPALPAPPARSVDPNWPLLLVASERLDVYMNSQLRGVARIDLTGRKPLLRLARSTAQRLGLTKGGRARLETAVAAIEVEVATDWRMLPDVVQLTHAATTPNVNAITSLADRDPVSGIPNLRACRCRVTPLAEGSAGLGGH